MTVDQDSPATPAAAAELRGVARFGSGALLGLAALVVGAVPFLALLLLVQDRWSPLTALDGDVAAALNAEVAGRPFLVQVLRVVTEGGGTGTAVYVMVLATAFLLIRQQRRLAAYVTVTGLGLAVLVPVSKALVGRDRPDVLLPVVSLPSNASFPSGHAMTSLVAWGVLLLLLLPVVGRRWRRPLVALTVLSVVAVGFTRLALGVHFVTDVVAGWALGAGWLLVTTAAFRGWQHDQGRPAPELLGGTDPPPASRSVRSRLAGARGSGPVVLRLVLGWLAVFALLSALGLLVTRVLDTTAVGRFDTEAVQALMEQRTGARTDVVLAVNALSGSRAVVLVAVAAAVLALAVTRSWRPVVFVAVAVLGEVSLYGAVAQVVDRARPGVPDLTSQLPTGASFPSGHVAAAAVVYGALVVLVVRYGRSRRRAAVLVLPLLLVPAIAVGRIYVAAHHPTDVLAGALLGVLWLLVAARVLLGPLRRGPAAHAGTAAAGELGGATPGRRGAAAAGRGAAAGTPAAAASPGGPCCG